MLNPLPPRPATLFELLDDIHHCEKDRYWWTGFISKRERGDILRNWEDLYVDCSQYRFHLPSYRRLPRLSDE